MVRIDVDHDFAVADLPGLIEGAANGVGLGIEFLRHIERTRVLLHVIDVGGYEQRDPYEDFLKINEELKKYDPALLDRPQIVVATKMDLPDAKENLEQLKAKLADDHTLPTPPVVMAISSVTHDGLQPLIAKTAEILDQTPAFPVKAWMIWMKHWVCRPNLIATLQLNRMKTGLGSLVVRSWNAYLR